MLLCERKEGGIVKNILTSYINIIKSIWSLFMNLGLVNFISLIFAFLLINILLSLLVYKLFSKMKEKPNFLIWIPGINIYYIACKSIHSLLSIIMILETFLLLPLPHKENNIWIVSYIIPATLQSMVLILLVLETLLSFVILIYNYVEYETQIRIVR